MGYRFSGRNRTSSFSPIIGSSPAPTSRGPRRNAVISPPLSLLERPPEADEARGPAFRKLYRGELQPLHLLPLAEARRMGDAYAGGVVEHLDRHDVAQI